MLNAKKTTFRPQYSSQEDDGTVSCVARTGLGAGSQESFGYTTKAEDADTSTSDFFHPSFSDFIATENILGVVNTAAPAPNGGAVHLLDSSVKNLKLFIQEAGNEGQSRVYNCQNDNCCSNFDPALCPDPDPTNLCEPCSCTNIFDCQTGGSPAGNSLRHHGWPLYDTRYFLSEDFQPPRHPQYWEMIGRKMWDPTKGGPLFKGEGQLVAASSLDDGGIFCNFCDRFNDCDNVQTGCVGSRGGGIVVNYDLENLCKSDNIFVVFKRDSPNSLKTVTTVEIRASRQDNAQLVGDLLFRDTIQSAIDKIDNTVFCNFSCVSCRWSCDGCDSPPVPGSVQSVHYGPGDDQSGSGNQIPLGVYSGHEPTDGDALFITSTVEIPDRSIVGATKQVQITKYGGVVEIPGNSTVFSGTPTTFIGSTTSTAAITIFDADFNDAKNNSINSDTELDQDSYGAPGRAGSRFQGGTGPVECEGATAEVAPGGAFLSFVLN